MKATLFKAPHGRKEELEVNNIRPEDAEFFEKHNVKISMEQLAGDVVVYADTGKITDGEPDELIQIAQGRSCEDVMSALRADCEDRFKEEGVQL